MLLMGQLCIAGHIWVACGQKCGPQHGFFTLPLEQPCAQHNMAIVLSCVHLRMLDAYLFGRMHEQPMGGL